jgi:hypothetical protein
MISQLVCESHFDAMSHCLLSSVLQVFAFHLSFGSAELVSVYDSFKYVR